MVNWKELNLNAVLIIANARIEKKMDSKNFGVQYTITKIDGEVRHIDITTKQGHSEWICDCKNCLTSKNKSNICSNKIAVIMQGQRELFI